MKCFHFSNGEKKEDLKTTKSTSGQSYNPESIDRAARQSGSEFDSQNVSTLSAEYLGRPLSTNVSQRPNNLRAFTFAELKAATKNFSRSLMVGEGGFGCVYRGAIRNSEDPNSMLEIAVKQLSRKGLQARLLLHNSFSFLLLLSFFLGKISDDINMN